MSAEKNDSAKVLERLIRLCDDLAWGRPADENALFELTKTGASTPELERLAEAFGMMTVKVEAREFQRAGLIEELEQRNRELEEARARLQERNVHLVETLRREYNVRRVIGHCEAMKRVVSQALAIARRPINTLILGPTGTGKEVIAKTIHYHSPRREAPFVAVNCTAIPDSLFESEMFGIEKGVATGVSARRGLVEEASGGTLFLDELADMSLANQAKLLRVLEEREVLRVGSARPVPVDIKVIAATNVNLEKAVRKDASAKISITASMWPNCACLRCAREGTTFCCWPGICWNSTPGAWAGPASVWPRPRVSACWPTTGREMCANSTMKWNAPPRWPWKT